MKYYVAGHLGMVGSAVCANLTARECDVVTRQRRDLDLTDREAVRAFFRAERPDFVIVAAARVGGIMANNTFPADFIQNNLMIASNIICAAHEFSARRLMMLSSSCVYPRLAAQPISESQLLAGPLEPTNEPYAIAKIAGMKLCESFNRQYGTDFRSVMPCNLYGPNDKYDLFSAHVLPALLKRFHMARQEDAKEVVVWGTGTPKREFLHVAEMAEALVFLMHLGQDEWRRHVPERLNHVNIGSGVETSIGDLAALIAKTTGYTGRISFDPSKPDGTPRKLLDVSLINKLGWKSSMPLEEGLESTYRSALAAGSLS